MTLLDIAELSVAFRDRSGTSLPVMSGASLTIAQGEAVGIYGDSGSGKTTLARAVMRLLPESSTCTGNVRFRDRDLLTLSQRQLQRVRGSEISLIFQEPSAALCPVRTIEHQVADVLRAHVCGSRRQALEEARHVLDLLFPDGHSRRIARSFPHELSGGERQRAVIAQSLCCRPSLLIADEPTASLDSVTQLEILRVLRECRERFGMAMLVISHDRGVLSFLADRVMRLRQGKMES